MTWQQFEEFGQRVGAIGATFLALIGYANWKGIWRWGTDYDKVCTERDEWKARALQLLTESQVSKKLVETAVAQTSKV